MSDQVLEQLHAWRSEHATDGLTPLDLDTIMTRGRRRRRVRHGLTVAVPTAVAGLLLVGTFGLVDARTSAQTVRPAEPSLLHSTVVEVPPGERVATSPGFDARLTAAGRFCYFRNPEQEIGCWETDWSSGPLTVQAPTRADADASTLFVIYGMYQGTGATDVIVHVPSGDYAATVVRLKDDPSVMGYYVEIPELGNEYPTVRVYDGQGQLLDELEKTYHPAPWNPPSAQEMRDRCQLSSSVPVVGNHPIGC